MFIQLNIFVFNNNANISYFYIIVKKLFKWEPGVKVRGGLNYVQILTISEHKFII